MKRIVGLLAVLVVVAVVASGCGGDDGGDEVSAGPPVTVDPDTAVSSPPAAPGDDEPPGTQWRRIEARDDLVDPVVATPDELVVDPDDPRTVLVRFYGGVEACYGARATVVEQSAARVRIRLETGGLPESTGPCIELAEAQELAVTLDEPVGDRRLVAVGG